ncbi:hypothetical protein B7463_g4246, partial [Scytalidium lignicola]
MASWLDHSGLMRSSPKGKAREVIEIPDDDEPQNQIQAPEMVRSRLYPPVDRRDSRHSHNLVLRSPQLARETIMIPDDNAVDFNHALTQHQKSPILVGLDDFAGNSGLIYNSENVLQSRLSKQKDIDRATLDDNSVSANVDTLFPVLDEQSIRGFLDAPLEPEGNGQILGENLIDYIPRDDAKRQKNYHKSPSMPTLVPVTEFGELLLDNLYNGSQNPHQGAGYWVDSNAEELAGEEIFPNTPNQLDGRSDATLENDESTINEALSPEQTRARGVDQVVAIFSGICRDYVSDLWDQSDVKNPEALIEVILERGSYPKAKDVEKDLKRKRAIDPDEEAAKNYTAADRRVPKSFEHIKVMRSLLGHEFPTTPMTFVNATLQQFGYRLLPAYQALEEADRNFDPKNPPYSRIQRARKPDPQLYDDELYESINTPYTEEQRRETLLEFQVARKLKKKAEAKLRAEREAAIAEEQNALEAEARGEMGECGCCFGDFPLNRMVHCDSDAIMHWFCRGCTKQNADTVIGQSKYELRCMSMDDCNAGFDMEQRSKFLDENTVIALDRNEQEAVLRLAGIENLASCPFCPYAAEYPPIEIDKEFRCQAPNCEKVSCRLCKLESHIPLSCEEFAKENGLSIRRQIEEAMSAALIRKCNKCNTPFIKEEGCNKMTCTRNGCYNIQCYVCHKSCTYDHFNDPGRGGKPGNCPLFENVEDRHNSEVKKAEREALKKVQEAHPEYNEEDLKIHLSEKVIKDDTKRRAKHARDRYVVPPYDEAHPILQPYQLAAANLMVPFVPAGNNNPNGLFPGLVGWNLPAIPQPQPPQLWPGQILEAEDYGRAFERDINHAVAPQPVLHPEAMAFLPPREGQPQEQPPALPELGQQYEGGAAQQHIGALYDMEADYLYAVEMMQQHQQMHGLHMIHQQEYRG